MGGRAQGDCARPGRWGAVFLARAVCTFRGTLLGYQLIRAVRNPLREMPKITIPLTQSFLRTSGSSLRERVVGLKSVLSAVISTLRDPRRDPDNDPLRRTRSALQSDKMRLEALEDEVKREADNIIAMAMEEEVSL